MCCNKEGIIVDRREMLRVKAKSLAEEARIIRKEETRTQGSLREELHWHRIKDVRSEARATYLAYGLIRGTALDRIERPTKDPRTEQLWKRVRAMAEKYGPLDKAARSELLARCAG